MPFFRPLARAALERARWRPGSLRTVDFPATDATGVGPNTRTPRQVVIIGAGLSGLTAGLYALGAGYAVTIVERENFLGGRCATESIAVGPADAGLSARFDTGATVWTMPEFLEQALAAVNVRPEQLDPSFRVERISPTYHADFIDRGGLDVFADPEEMVAELSRFGATDATLAGYHRMRAWLKELFDASYESFMSRSFDHVGDLLSGSQSLQDLTTLLRLGAFGALEPKIQGFLGDDDLARVFSFQALYAGVAPAQARAVYGTIAHMDTSLGAFYPHSEQFGSGMGTIAQLLAAGFRQAGGTILMDTKCLGFDIDDQGLVRGVRLQAHSRADAATDSVAAPVASTATTTVAADAVIATVDLPVVQQWAAQAAPGRARASSRNRILPLRYSPSAVVAHGLVPVSTTSQWPQRHHLISFGTQWDETFREISAARGGRIMSDPSLLVTRPAVSDPGRIVTDAQGAAFEPVSVLAPTPNLHSAELDWQALGEAYVAEVATVLEQRGLVGIAQQWQVGRIDTPADYAARDMAAGSPFGVAHLFRQTGPFRPRNLSATLPGNVVLAGSTTVPGVGVPTVMISGKLAAERLGAAS